MPRATAIAAEPKSWEFGGRGNWSEVQTPSTGPVANASLDQAEQLLTRGDVSAAE